MSGASNLSWDEQAARQAIKRYEGLVRLLARRLKPVAAVGQALDEDDLMAEGRVAVLEALSTYEGYGIQERTWVRTRIRQRMIDAIRKMDLRSRDELRLLTQCSENDQGSDQDKERRRSVVARRLVSMDASAAQEEPLCLRLADIHAKTVDEVVELRDQHRQLLHALEGLPQRQRTALELSLFQGMPLRAIGQRMGISESRVCQLQRRAVEHLHESIAPPPVSEAA